MRQFMIGKIAASPISSVFNPVVGIQFTNTPTASRKSFGTYTLSNYTTPNWTVELYVNNILIDYVKADASGFFTFNVPLIYGNTDVTLRYYGPWGEELSSKKNFTIPFNFLPPKELEYKISSGLIEDGKNSLFGQARMNYGVTKDITFGGGLEYNSSIATANYKNIVFVNTSIRLAPNVLFSGDYVYGVRYKGLLNYNLPSNFQLEAYYSKYNPAQQAIRLNYTEERKLTISKPFVFATIPALSRLAISQNLIQQPNSDVPPTKYTIPELSLSGASHGINLNITTLAFVINKLNTSFYSDVSLSTVLPGGILFTPQIRYDYKRNQISMVKYRLEKRFVKYGVITASYQNNLLSNFPIYQVGFRYDFSFARVGVTVLQSNNINSISEFASGSLIYQPQLNYRDINVNTNVGRGGVIFLPFLDINNNGVKDPNEPKVSGLNVNMIGGGIQKSNKDTTIVISGLEPYTTHFVEVDADNFENMSWRIKKSKMNIIIEPNKLKLIEIPVLILGEVSGTAYLKKENEEKGLGRITVCFYNSDSVLVNKMLTESDGYFNFFGLLPGSYYAKIDQEQLNKLQMTASPSSLSFTIKGGIEGDVVDGLKFILQSNTKAIIKPVAEKQFASKKDSMSEMVNSSVINTQPETKVVTNIQVSDTLSVPIALNARLQEESIKQDNNKQSQINTAENQIINEQGKFAIQVKAHSQLSDAKVTESTLGKAFKQPIAIVNEAELYKVRITGFDDRDKAAALIPKLKELGFADAFVIAPAKNNNNIRQQQAISSSLNSQKKDSANMKSQSIKDAFVKNDIIKAVSDTVAKKSKTNEQGYFAVQARAHTQLSDAKATQSKLSKIFKQPVVIVNEDGLYKVRISEFNKRDEALAIIPKLDQLGFAGAFIIYPSQIKAAPARIAESAITNEQGDFAVQVGAHSQVSNAETAKLKLAKIIKQPLEIVNEEGLYKVRITGFNNHDEALAILPMLSEYGFVDAFVLKSSKKTDNSKTSTSPVNTGNNRIKLDSAIKILNEAGKSKKELSHTELTRMEEMAVTKNDVIKRSKFGDKAIYSVQIASHKEGLPQNTLAVVLKLQTEVESYKDKNSGLTKYFTGNYKSYNEALKAKNELSQKGFKSPFIIVIDKGEIISVKDYNKRK